MHLGFATDAGECHQSIVSNIIFFAFLKTGETIPCCQSSGTSPRANDSMKMSANRRDLIATLFQHSGMLYVHLIHPTTWQALLGQLLCPQWRRTD